MVGAAALRASLRQFPYEWSQLSSYAGWKKEMNTVLERDVAVLAAPPLILPLGPRKIRQ